MKKCPFCGTEYDTPFCPNGCDVPAAPYITQRQQDEQGCPFCGSNRIQVKKIEKKRLFGKKTKTKLVRFCTTCGRIFR